MCLRPIPSFLRLKINSFVSSISNFRVFDFVCSLLEKVTDQEQLIFDTINLALVSKIVSFDFYRPKLIFSTAKTSFLVFMLVFLYIALKKNY